MQVQSIYNASRNQTEGEVNSQYMTMPDDQPYDELAEEQQRVTITSYETNNNHDNINWMSCQSLLG